MKILVAGGAGFIGSHVVDAYVQAGHDVVVVDDLSSGKEANVNPAARFYKADISLRDELEEIFQAEGFDAVNHHAAQIDVRLSVADPARDARINILGTLNLLEAARVYGVSRIIFASTGGAIYGEAPIPTPETWPASPVSPYGIAKLAAEHYLDYYRQTHGLRYTVLRYANVCGPRQDPQGEAGVVAIFCGRILRGERLIIYGDGEQTRDFVFVADVARANLLALHHLSQEGESAGFNGSGLAGRSSLNTPRSQRLNSVFNIGTGIETSVNALAAMLLEAAEADCPIIYQPGRPGEQARSAIHSGKAARLLEWTPLTPVAEGLAQTLAWFRSEEPVSSQARMYA